MLKIYRFLFVILLLLTSTIAEAQEITLDPYPSHKYSFVDYFKQDWTTVSGASRIEYVGVHDIVIPYLQRRFVRYAKDQLWEYYHLSNMSQETFDRELAEIDSQWHYYGEWWDRPWFYSLPVERGGAPRNPQKVEVGWKISIPKNFPVIYWIKEQIMSLGDIWLTDERAYINLRDSNQVRQYITPHDDPREELKEPVNVIFEGQGYSWYNGTNHHLRFRPSIRISPGLTLKEIFSEYNFKVVIETYIKDHTVHLADLVFTLSHDINNDIVYGSVDLIMFIF